MRILEVAKDVDTNTMTLQYLETLKQIGASPSTKFVVPAELTSLLQGVLGSRSATAQSPPAGEVVLAAR